MDITAARTLHPLYIYLDLAWLAIYFFLLLAFKRRLAILAGLAAGVIYFLVDYGIFYLALGTRVVQGADPLLFLLWLSFSYGFTNFAWIWLLLDRDGHAVEWSLVTICGWLAVALLSQGLGASSPTITISRGTHAYHGVMALILLAGYLFLAVRNLRLREQGSVRVDLLRLLAIGIGVQFSWEFVLLISGIRPPDLLPLVVNSLIETNLGMPFIYLIHRTVTGR
jgi:hypothetical protein